MIYYSTVTAKGNSSWSCESQADAEAKARYLDDHHCSDCSRCSDCSDCSDCSGCSGCSGITDGSKGVIQAGRPDNWPAYGWLKDGQLIIHVGCRRKTFAEAVGYWSNKPDR